MALIDVDEMKKRLRIEADESDFDAEVLENITSAIDHLKGAGVDETVVDTASDERVNQLIVIYTKTFFGYDIRDNIKELPQAYWLMLNQLKANTEENLAEELLVVV